MSANQACFPIAFMAGVLGVSKAGYYAWRHRPPSARVRADEALLARIKTVHISSHQTYGAPRVRAELRAAGERHGRKRIARLMRAAGLVGASRRRGGPITTRRDKQARPAPDLVERDFQAASPNQLWVADITYVPTAAGFLYLAVVVDVWSRRVVGWAMANHLRAELVLDALNMALGQRRPREVIHHSDQSLPRRRPGVANIPRWLSARAARKPACGLRWARSGMPMTTPCARASLPPSNANCSSGAALPHRSRHAWPASASSKASTIPPGGTPPSGIARPFATNRRCKQTDSPLPPEPSTKTGQLQYYVLQPRERPLARMASVTWPLLVAAAPSSRSRKVARPRAGTAAAMHAMTLARMGGMGGWDIG